MKTFEFRKSCEYIVEVKAETEVEAWAKLPDDNRWEHSWSATEVEELGLDFRILAGICREDNPVDVDEAYGAGTYARLFPPQND